MNRAVTGIWVFTLAAALVAVVPAAITWLQRILQAAQRIERYTEEIRDAGAGIAANTASVPALKDTIATAGALLGGARSIEGYAGAIGRALGGEQP